jgi:hypothetical protein
MALDAKMIPSFKSTSQSQVRERKQKESQANTRNLVHLWWEAINGSYVAIPQVWMIISGWMFQTVLSSSSFLCTNPKWYVSPCCYEYHILTHGNTVALYYCCQACDSFLPRRCEYCCVRWLETQTIKIIRFEFKLQKKFASWIGIYKKED